MRKLSALTVYIQPLMTNINGNPSIYEAAVTYEREGASITDIHHMPASEEFNLSSLFEDIATKVSELEDSDFGDIK